MKFEDLMKLVNAGFTKEEIFKLNRVNSAPAEVTNSEPEAPKPEAPKPEAPKEEPKIADEVNRAVSEAMKPFEDLYGKFSKLVNMPSMENVQPKGIEDIFDNFFKGE